MFGICFARYSGPLTGWKCYKRVGYWLSSRVHVDTLRYNPHNQTIPPAQSNQNIPIASSTDLISNDSISTSQWYIRPPPSAVEGCARALSHGLRRAIRLHDHKPFNQNIVSACDNNQCSVLTGLYCLFRPTTLPGSAPAKRLPGLGGVGPACGARVEPPGRLSGYSFTLPRDSGSCACPPVALSHPSEPLVGKLQ